MFPAKIPCQLQPGQVLNGKYRIEGELGSGGFGRVYAALNLNLHKRVAIKLRLELGPDTRLWREAQLAAALKSPHSVRIFDVDRLEDGTPYIVMEFLEGQTLREYLRSARKAPVTRAVTWTLQICEALAEAHAAGLVHRDIKPSNLFLVGYPPLEAQLKLVDFGLAKHVDDSAYDTVTDDGVVVGSPAYMAPERVRADVGTAQTDIWSVGVVLFEMLCGELPFEGSTNSALLASIVADPPRPFAELAPDLPAALGAIIARCLRKRAEDRYASADTLAHDLREFSNAAPPRIWSDEAVTVSTTISERPSQAGAERSSPAPWRWLLGVGLLGVPLLVWALSPRSVSSRDDAASARSALGVSEVASVEATLTASSSSVPEQVRPAEPLRRSASSPGEDSKPPERGARPPVSAASSSFTRPGVQALPQRRSPAPAPARAPNVLVGASASAAPRLITEPDF